MMGLLPILWLAILLTMLAMLVLQLWFYTDHNRLQKTLMVIIILWFLMFLGLEISLIRVYNGTGTPVKGVLNFHNILLGLVGMFSLLSYPSVVLHPHLVKVRHTILLLSPVLLTLLIYVVWHLFTDTSMNYRYLTIVELWENRWSVPVLLRLLMLFFFICYLVTMLWHFWQLVPIYNRYSEDNYSDAVYNVRWLRIVISAVGSICVAYIVVLICKNPLWELLYAIVTGVFFCILTDNAVSHRLFSNHINVQWSLSKGWYRAEESVVVEDCTNDEKQLRQLDQWMDEQKLFLNPDFCAKDLYAVFPELKGKLSALLEHRDHTFQSYVRDYRIKEACRLMMIAPELSNKELAFKLGFTIASSFNRAFVAVMKMTPQSYKKEQLKER